MQYHVIEPKRIVLHIHTKLTRKWYPSRSILRAPRVCKAVKYSENMRYAGFRVQHPGPTNQPKPPLQPSHLHEAEALLAEAACTLSPTVSRQLILSDQSRN